MSTCHTICFFSRSEDSAWLPSDFCITQYVGSYSGMNIIVWQLFWPSQNNKQYSPHNNGCTPQPVHPSNCTVVFKFQKLILCCLLLASHLHLLARAQGGIYFVVYMENFYKCVQSDDVGLLYKQNWIIESSAYFVGNNAVFLYYFMKDD